MFFKSSQSSRSSAGRTNTLLSFMSAFMLSGCLAHANTTMTVAGIPACNGGAQATFPLISMATDVTRDSNNRLIFNDVAITKIFNDCSVWLQNAMFKGAKLPNVVISSFVNVNGRLKEVMRITMTNVLVSAVATSISSSDNSPLEQYRFTYQIITIQDLGSNSTTNVDRGAGWDIQKNKQV
jgi:type VI protein secretion system component Hcp